MNELAVYSFQNAYSEVLINMACLNKTETRLSYSLYCRLFDFESFFVCWVILAWG